MKVELLQSLEAMRFEDETKHGYVENDFYVSSDEEMDTEEIGFCHKVDLEGGEEIELVDMPKIDPRIMEAFETSSPYRLRLLTAIWRFLEGQAAHQIVWEVLENLASENFENKDLVWVLMCESRSIILRQLCVITQASLNCSDASGADAQRKEELPRTYAEIENEVSFVRSIVKSILDSPLDANYKPTPEEIEGFKDEAGNSMRLEAYERLAKYVKEMDDSNRPPPPSNPNGFFEVSGMPGDEIFWKEYSEAERKAVASVQGYAPIPGPIKDEEMIGSQINFNNLKNLLFSFEKNAYELKWDVWWKYRKGTPAPINICDFYDFMRQRPYDQDFSCMDRMGYPSYEGEGWWRVPVADPEGSLDLVDLKSAKWEKTWYAASVYSAPNILRYGIPPSWCKALGHRYFEASPGTYLHAQDEGRNCEFFCNYVPFRNDGVFWGVKFECFSDKSRRYPSKRGSTLAVQHLGSTFIIAMWVRGLNTNTASPTDHAYVGWEPTWEFANAPPELPPGFKPIRQKLGFVEGDFGISGKATSTVPSKPGYS